MESKLNLHKYYMMSKSSVSDNDSCTLKKILFIILNSNYAVLFHVQIIEKSQADPFNIFVQQEAEQMINSTA